MTSTSDPHADTPVLTAGPGPADGRLTVVMVHGRGGSAEDILSLARELDVPDVSWIAPQAAGHTWYPYSFLTAIEENEPALSSALRAIDRLVGGLAAEGVEPGRIALLGFSQGACLSLEYAVRHPRRYAALVGFSGGLIGPPGTVWNGAGDFEDTPVFLGCSDVDPHIPLERVQETASVFRRMRASVDERIYPRMGHTINREEIAAAARLLGR